MSRIFSFVLFIETSIDCQNSTFNESLTSVEEWFTDSTDRMNSTTKPVLSSTPQSSKSFLLVLLVIIVFFCTAFVVLCIISTVRKRRKKKEEIDPELLKPPKLTKSMIEDLPSSDVQPISIPSKELKPVDNKHYN